MPGLPGDRGAGALKAVRQCRGGGRPVLRRRSGDRDRLPRPQRVGQVDHDAHDHGPRLAGVGLGHRAGPALPRPPLAAAGGRGAARSQGHPSRSLRPRPPAHLGQEQCHRSAARRRGARARRSQCGSGQAGWQVLARDGPAPGHCRRSARRPGSAVVRRARERPRSRGHPLGAHTVQEARRRGSYRVRVQPPDGRDGAHRRPSRRHRQGQADRRDHGGRLRGPQLAQVGQGAHAGAAPIVRRPHQCGRDRHCGSRRVLDRDGYVGARGG